MAMAHARSGTFYVRHASVWHVIGLASVTTDREGGGECFRIHGYHCPDVTALYMYRLHSLLANKKKWSTALWDICCHTIHPQIFMQNPHH